VSIIFVGVLMDIINKFKLVHSDEYDYSDVQFINTTTKISVKCKKHGPWLITPKNHLKGRGCPVCAKDKISKSKSMNFTDFIKKANIIHDNRYLYTQDITYKNLDSFVQIECKRCHNAFSLKAKYHLHDKVGCNTCSKIKRIIPKRSSFKKFVDLSNLKHENQYEYDEKSFISLSHDTHIKCRKCNNSFITNARNHSKGFKKCQACFPVENINKIGHDEFVKRSDIIHQGRYDYSLQKVDILLNRVNIKCKVCNNEFSILPHTHIRNSFSCCKICFPNNQCIEEKEIVSFIKQYPQFDILENCKDIIHPKEIDIFIPQKNLAIEYNGLFWHKEDKILNSKYHYDKYNLCKEKGIKLIQFFSDEWKQKNAICKSMIRYRLGLIKESIHARKCVIKKINNKIAYNFQQYNHISGGVYSKYNVGLFHNNELVSCLSFRKPFSIDKKDTLEISRFCNKINTVVNGAFSKLMNYFLENINNGAYNNILTYADLRFGEGDVYKNYGFEFKGHTGFDYWYTDNVSRFNRFKIRTRNGIKEKDLVQHKKLLKIFGTGSNIFNLIL
jgi:hypothetical protein